MKGNTKICPKWWWSKFFWIKTEEDQCTGVDNYVFEKIVVKFTMMPLYRVQDVCW